MPRRRCIEETNISSCRGRRRRFSGRKDALEDTRGKTSGEKRRKVSSLRMDSISQGDALFTLHVCCWDQFFFSFFLSFFFFFFFPF